MQSSQLLEFVIKQIDNMKGRDVVKLDVRGKSTITDFMVVCSGNSKKHVQSIGELVYIEAKNNDINIMGMEGKDSGEWVLVDLGNVIVHVMQESTRDFYQLEKLWG